MARVTNDDVIANFPKGDAVTLTFTITDATTGQPTPVDGVQAGGFAGYTVPVDYDFLPTSISVTGNTATTAGVATIAVTDNDVEIVNGPEAVLDTTNTLTNTGLALRAGANRIVAGNVVGVSSIGTASHTPITVDLFVTLTGRLVNQ